MTFHLKKKINKKSNLITKMGLYTTSDYMSTDTSFEKKRILYH